MLYLLEVYALVAILVFGASGLVIAFLFGLFQLKALAMAVRHRMSFATRLAISRMFSRAGERVPFASQKSQ